MIVSHPRASVLCAALLLACAIGCGGKDAPPPTAVPPSIPSTSSTTAVRVQIVDLEGRPIAGMMPIATRSPNAFDEPLAKGQLTKEDGSGTLAIPTGDRVFVRAWDPALKYFANNYLEVDPGPEAAKDTLGLVMVPGASLDAVLTTSDGTPAANVKVAIMMLHPTEGPWWPTEANTDAQGALHIPAVPAGKFTVRIKTSSGGHTEIPEVTLRPGGHADLATVILE